jgi:hypothetical protein
MIEFEAVDFLALEKGPVGAVLVREDNAGRRFLNGQMNP